jgi:hypothetical protein
MTKSILIILQSYELICQFWKIQILFASLASDAPSSEDLLLLMYFIVWGALLLNTPQSLNLELLLKIFWCSSELPTYLICFIVHSSHWNFILWFCTLEHLLLTPIVILILCYHQNLLSTRRLLSDPLCSNTPTSLLHHQRDSIMAEWKIWIQPPNAIFSNQAAQS